MREYQETRPLTAAGRSLNSENTKPEEFYDDLSGQYSICSRFCVAVNPPMLRMMASPAQVSHFEVLASMNIRLPTSLLITFRHL